MRELLKYVIPESFQSVPFDYARCLPLPENTPSSQNIGLPIFHNHMRHSKNLSLPLRIYTPFRNYYLCNATRIYPTLPGSTPSFFGDYARCDFSSRNLPQFSTTIMRHSWTRSLLEYTPLFATTYDTPWSHI